MKSWNAQKITLAERLADGRRDASGKTIEVVGLLNFLEAVIRTADRVCLEGDNQKQADVLAAALTDVDPAKIHDLMVESGVVLPEHFDEFEKGIARRLDYSYSGRSRRASRRCCSAAKSSWGRCTPILSCSDVILST
jgi:malonate decarboxylase alpha subunit